MSNALIRDIARRVRDDDRGPVDINLSNDEYENLKPTMGYLWSEDRWSCEECLFVLAFLRGYTLYRDISENENHFWQGFHEELLGIKYPMETINENQRDLLWKAFKVHPYTHKRKIYINTRRFVTTIYTVWGVHALRSQELVKSFVDYYRSYRGKALDEQLVQKIITVNQKNPKETLLGQIKTIDRVFAAMIRVIDVILKDGLEGLIPSSDSDVDELERQLLQRGVDLGDSPNALRYFWHKSHGSIARIINTLRRQRTREQFKSYMRSRPNAVIKPPNRQKVSARHLASVDEDLPYGWYVENNEEQHEVTPDARISLKVLGEMPRDTFDDFGDITLYTSKDKFDVKVGNRKETSQPFFTKSGRKRHFWLGTKPGVSVTIKGKTHQTPQPAPRPITSLSQAIASIASRVQAQTKTRLILDDSDPYLQGEISLNVNVPDATRSFTLQVGTELFDVKPHSKGQKFSFRLPISGTEAYLEYFGNWKWHGNTRLFTPVGTEITEKHLKRGFRMLYCTSQQKPAITTGSAYVEQISASLPLWQIIWDGHRPLTVEDWHIQSPYPTIRATQSPLREIREGISVQLHKGYFTSDETISIPVQDMPVGTKLYIGTKVFTKDTAIPKLPVSGLTPGYRGGVFMQGNQIVGELAPFRVLPSLTWHFSDDAVLIDGHTYTSRVTLSNGYSTQFTWIPLQKSNGNPGR